MKMLKKAVALLLVVGVMAVMAGCGVNVKDYVTESLDFAFKGALTEDYAKMTGRTMDELKQGHEEQREKAYDNFINQIGYVRTDISEESFEKVKATFEKVYGLLKYEVTEVKSVDGGYQATVEYYPLVLTGAVTPEAITKAITPIYEKYLSEYDTSDEALRVYTSMVSDAVMELYNKAVESPVYGDAESTTINVKLEDKILSISEDQVAKFDLLMFR